MTKPNRPMDQKCLDLAQHFMGDVKGHVPEDAQELAEAIQSLCEDFCGAIAADEAGK